MGDLHDDLREVMGLLGKATPGPWAHTKRNDPEAPASIASGMDRGMAYAVAMCPRFRGDDWHKDADAIVSAVAFLRQHGPAILARQEGEDGDAVLAAMNEGYTVRKGLPSTFLTDEANAEFAWIVERAVPPFCGKKGVGMWHASTPREAIAKARAAIDAARSGGGGGL